MTYSSDHEPVVIPVELELARIEAGAMLRHGPLDPTAIQDAGLLIDCHDRMLEFLHAPMVAWRIQA